MVRKIIKIQKNGVAYFTQLRFLIFERSKSIYCARYRKDSQVFNGSSDLFPLQEMFEKMLAEKIMLKQPEFLSTTSVKLFFLRSVLGYDRFKYSILAVSLQEFVYQTRYSRKLYELLTELRRFLESNYYCTSYLVEVKGETILYKGLFFTVVPGKHFHSVKGRGMQ